MIYVVNDDAPGLSGGSVRCWATGASISARSTSAGGSAGGEAVLLLSLDQPVDQSLIDEAEALEGVRTVTALSF